MTLVDTIIVLLLVGGFVAGYMRGFIAQAASIAGYVLGILACIFLGDAATEMFRALMPSSADWPMSDMSTHIVAVSVLFLLVALSVRVVGLFVTNIAKRLHIGMLERMAGGALGAFKYLFLLSILLNFVLVLSPNGEMSSTEHMLQNKPFELTIDMVPAIFGAETMPSDSLALYRNDSTRQAADSINGVGDSTAVTIDGADVPTK